MLSAADYVYGMVGAEHDAHVLRIVAFAHFFRQPCRFGGGRVAQFVGKGLNSVIFLFALLAHIAIGTHGKAMQRNFAFLCPL